jgi:hypothetical protein
VKQTTYDNKGNIAAQWQTKHNTKGAIPEIIPQQCHQYPGHHDKKGQQPCFFLRDIFKPNDSTKQTFRAWKVAKSARKKPKGRSQAGRNSQVRNEVEQHERGTQTDSLLQRMEAWKFWQQSTARRREPKARASIAAGFGIPVRQSIAQGAAHPRQRQDFNKLVRTHKNLREEMWDPEVIDPNQGTKNEDKKKTSPKAKLAV